MSFDRYSEKSGYEADLEAASKVTLIAYQSIKKVVKSQPGKKEIATAKAVRLEKVEAAKEGLEKAKTAESTFACLANDFFCKLL